MHKADLSIDIEPFELAGWRLIPRSDVTIERKEEESGLSGRGVLNATLGPLTVRTTLSADLSGRNKRFLPTLIMAVSLGLNLLLNLLWTRRFGIRGAAWASTLAYGSQALLMMLYFWKATGVGPGQLLLPRKEDLTAYADLAQRLRARARARHDRPYAAQREPQPERVADA